MTPMAAEELLDVIMHDDVVARRKALDVWVKRWVASVKLEEPMNLKLARQYEQIFGPGSLEVGCKGALLDKTLRGMMLDENVKAIGFEVKDDGSMRVATLHMSVLLQEPQGGAPSTPEVKVE